MRIYVFTTEPTQYFSKELEKSANQFQIDFEVIDFNNLILSDNVNDSKLYHNDKELVIDNETYIVSRFSFENAYFKLSILEYCVSKGARIINTPNGLRMCNDKLHTQIKLTSLGVKTPWTISVINKDSKFLKQIESLKDPLIPCVLKTNHGTHGIGVMKIDSKESLISVVQAFLDQQIPILIQEYIEHNASYRIIMLGDKVLASNKKTNEDADFRTNSHLGSTTEKHEPNEKEIAICKTISSGFKCNFCAIDYLLVNDEVIVLEVNGSPGLEYIQKDYPDRNLTDEIVKYIKDSVIPSKQKEYCVNCIIDGIEYEAKIDTGASISSIHATNINHDGDSVSFDFEGKQYNLPLIRIVNVKSSLGKQQRPVVNFEMNIDDSNITTPVSLADRSGLKYKILIGYQTLQDFGKSINLNNLTNNQ